MNPKMSVVIPAYNEARFIQTCLKSLKDQDFAGAFEIIVVDNHSRDSTGALASGMATRVIYEPARGVCAARQAGTLVAKGNVIVSTDADTVFPRNWLRRLWAEFANQPDVVAVAGACEYVGAPWWARLYTQALFGIMQARYALTGRIGYISACNTAFRKSAWTGYNTRLTQGGDEFGLLSQLKPKGRIVFQRDNVVLTSSRRLSKGLWYNLFITIGLYYGVDYLVGKITGASLLGSYAPIRHEQAPIVRPGAWARRAAVVMVVIIALSLVTHRVSAARVLQVTKMRLASWQHNIYHHHR